MKPAELLDWFKQIAWADLGPTRVGMSGEFYGNIATIWLANAESALHHAFPPAHPIQTQWHKLYVGTEGKEYELRIKQRVDAWRSIFVAALNQLNDGRLRTVADGITAENTADLLDQAEALLPQYHIAAAVIVGGALETFLHHHCAKHGLAGKGTPSIAAYQQALGQHRNATGVEIVSATDEKQLIAWGGIRNDAAHRPLEFNRSADEVRLFLAGVRGFISKYS